MFGKQSAVIESTLSAVNDTLHAVNCKKKNGTINCMQGIEERSEYKSKKTGCKAMIRLLRTEDGWYISTFVAEHNHELTDSCQCIKKAQKT